MHMLDWSAYRGQAAVGVAKPCIIFGRFLGLRFLQRCGWRLRERDEDCVPVGGEASLGVAPRGFFFPSGLAEAAGPEKGVGDQP